MRSERNSGSINLFKAMIIVTVSWDTSLSLHGYTTRLTDQTNWEPGSGFGFPSSGKYYFSFSKQQWDVSERHYATL